MTTYLNYLLDAQSLEALRAIVSEILPILQQNIGTIELMFNAPSGYALTAALTFFSVTAFNAWRASLGLDPINLGNDNNRDDNETLADMLSWGHNFLYRDWHPASYFGDFVMDNFRNNTIGSYADSVLNSQYGREAFQRVADRYYIYPGPGEHDINTFADDTGNFLQDWLRLFTLPSETGITDIELAVVFAKTITLVML